MQFVFPNFLWALFLLAIPIIIHLFYFRRFKKVYFTNIRFLKEVKEETNSRNKLKNLLILLSRLLALSFLILAFAQPFLPSENQKSQGKKGISIYIDNSFSMSALSNDVSLLNKARQKAREIISAYGDDERFQILSNNFSAAQQRVLSKEEALNVIEEIQERPEVYPLSQVLNRQRQALNQENFDTKIYFQISDFQRSISDNLPLADTTEILNLIPLQSVQDINVSIDSTWFLSKVPMVGQTNQLVIKLTNRSNEDRNGVRLSILFDGQNRPLGVVNIKANSSIIDTANINITTGGWNTGEVNIEDYPITFDDRYQFAFEAKEKLKVLTIDEAGSNRYLTALLKSIPFISAENQPINQVNYAAFAGYELIIMNDAQRVTSGMASALDQYVKEGGNVLIFPNRNADLQTLNTFLSQLNTNTLTPFTEGAKDVGSINTDEFIFRDVFESRSNNIKLPKVIGSYGFNTFQSKGEEALLVFRDGSTYIGKYQSGNGHIYLCSAPLNVTYNDLVQNAEIFVPMVFKMATSSGSKSPISYTIGINRIIEMENEKDNNDIVYNFSGPQDFIPSQMNAGSKILLNVGDNIIESGIYDVKLSDRLIRKVAFNYNNLESELDYYNTAELQERYGETATVFTNQMDSNFTQIITEQDLGVAYYKWCILITLIFLGIEILLLRLWKT